MVANMLHYNTLYLVLQWLKSDKSTQKIEQQYLNIEVCFMYYAIYQWKNISSNDFYNLELPITFINDLG